MGLNTDIEYCDSSVNAIIGCSGCELWNPQRNIYNCYAGNLVSRYKGLKGWPQSFEQPKLFLSRLDKALKWSDLSETGREKKPWLSKFPRVIFLNDLSDTFDPKVSLEWLDRALPQMEATPHIWLLLTKRAVRMAEYFTQNRCPDNVWPGVSVTSQETLHRIGALALITARIKWVSFEPLLSPIQLSGEFPFQWAVIGGGSNMPPGKSQWFADLIAQLYPENVAIFFKQYGNLKINPDKTDPTAKENGGLSKGGRKLLGRTWNEMPQWKGE